MKLLCRSRFWIALIAFVAAGGCGSPAGASTVRVEKTDQGWVLLVDSQPYVVKGLCFQPATVGESSDNATWRDWMVVDDNKNGRNDFAYDSYVDKNGNNRRDRKEPVVGDFQLLKELGANTIRLYHHASTETHIQALHDSPNTQLLYNHPPNKTLLRDLFHKYGIRVAMGDLLGAYTVATGTGWEDFTDYTDPEQKRRMMLSVEAMVREFKDEPFILMWVLGNENTNARATHTKASDQYAAYGQFVNQAARRIKEMDPHHPVCLCEWDGPVVRDFSQYIPDVDIFGINSYRHPGFGTLWKVLSRRYDKPVLITEYGVSYPQYRNEVLDEDYLATVYERGWADIEAHTAGGSQTPAIVIGGFAFEWLDNWFFDGEPDHQNVTTNWNQEVCGICSQGNGRNSPFLRHLRKTYFSLQKRWTRKND